MGAEEETPRYLQNKRKSTKSPAKAGLFVFLTCFLISTQHFCTPFPISAMAEMGKGVYNRAMSKEKFLNYKGVKVNAFGLPIFGKEKKKQSFVGAEKRVYHVSFLASLKKDAPKNLIVMYDVPHQLKVERDWLRRQLVSFGYIMIQKSVWVGPSPLPKDFLNYTKEIELGDKFKTFKLAKQYSPSISAMA